MKKKTLLKKFIKIYFAAAFIIVAFVVAPFAHTSYLLHRADSNTAYLLQRVGSNTVYIESPEGASIRGSATGFEVKVPSGAVYTLTNAHVCMLQHNGFVMVGEKQHSGRLIPRRVIEVFEDNDLCLVEGLAGYDGLTLAGGYEIGEQVYALGYPLGEALNLSEGLIKEKAFVEIAMQEIPANECTRKNEHVEGYDTIFGSIKICMIKRLSLQTSAVIYPGNSGSALIDAFGNVTGVVFASNRTSNWGSAVPLEDVIDFLKAY